MNTAVFREYDIRGIVNKDLDDMFVFDLGRAVGSYGKKQGAKTMTVGRDCRLTSERYGELIVDGIASAGIHVVDLGLCATPMLYYSIRDLDTDGGVMVTGSHNPPEFNGFKICIGPDTIYGDEIQGLRKIMEAGDYVTGSGAISRCDVSASYYDYIYEHIDIEKPFRIAVDGGNGVGGFFAVPLLERFGCHVIPLYCDTDGHFPHHHPDPTIEENLSELITMVTDKELDAGIAFDGDADRMGIITDTGEILWGDEILILFSRFVLKEIPGATIIGEVKCSQRLYDDIEKNGGRAIMWKAGHSLMRGKLRETHAALAGEMSGHLFFADRYFGFDDAIYASARLLEALSKSGMKLSEILSDLPKSFSTPEIRIECPDALKFQVVDKVKDFFREGYDIIDIDGVRVRFDNGWGLVRASNTQPVIVLRFESPTPEGLRSIRTFIENVVNDAMASVRQTYPL